MTIALVGVSGTAGAIDVRQGNAANMAPGQPPGAAEFDLFLMACWCAGNDTTFFTTPSQNGGWAEADPIGPDAGADGNANFFMKAVPAGGLTSPTNSLSGGSSDVCFAHVAAFRGVKLSDPIDETKTVRVLNDTGTAVGPIGLPTLSPGQACILLMGKGNDVAAVTDPTTGTTPDWQRLGHAVSTLGNDGTMTWWFISNTTSQNLALGSVTISVTGGDSGDDNIVVCRVLNPAVAPVLRSPVQSLLHLLVR